MHTTQKGAWSSHNRFFFEKINFEKEIFWYVLSKKFRNFSRKCSPLSTKIRVTTRVFNLFKKIRMLTTPKIDPMSISDEQTLLRLPDSDAHAGKTTIQRFYTDPVPISLIIKKHNYMTSLA